MEYLLPLLNAIDEYFIPYCGAVVLIFFWLLSMGIVAVAKTKNKKERRLTYKWVINALLFWVSINLVLVLLTVFYG